MKYLVAALLCVILLLGGYIAYSQGLLNRFVDPKLVQICEGLVKDRLRSPSTYRRIKVTQYSEAVSLEKARALDPKMTQTEVRAITEGRAKPTNFQVFITFEAANAFGTPVSGLSLCEYYSAFGDDTYASKFSVKIDGKTSTDWLIEGITAGKKK
ncbi:MAG: hypothetical protein AB7U46_08275 [Paenirhodobacter sp.]|uniref:hypothetical protein n=1 Tax=Paenirhodobacter sp. TaxID=1965326 RepID=UPI003D147A9D